jgi:hypothetical protein
VARWSAEDRREGFANMLDFIGDNRGCPELSPDDTFMAEYQEVRRIQPVWLQTANGSALKRSLEQARERWIQLGPYQL